MVINISIIVLRWGQWLVAQLLFSLSRATPHTRWVFLFFLLKQATDICKYTKQSSATPNIQCMIILSLYYNYSSVTGGESKRMDWVSKLSSINPRTKGAFFNSIIKDCPSNELIFTSRKRWKDSFSWVILERWWLFKILTNLGVQEHFGERLESLTSTRHFWKNIPNTKWIL